jgi:predicted ATP-binding protein involved in virulence
MHIQQVKIKNFRCFEDLTVNLNPDVNIFVGNNGSGKSAVLDAIAAAMYPYIYEFQHIILNKAPYRFEIPIHQSDLQIKKPYKDIEGVELSIIINSILSWKIICYEDSLDNRNEPLDMKYQEDSLRKITHNALEILNAMRKNLDCNLPVIAYYKGDRNSITLTNIKDLSFQRLNRFDALKDFLNSTSNFADLADWFFTRKLYESREGEQRKDITFEFHDLKQIRKAISIIIAPNANVYFAQNTSSKLMVEWETETGEKIELSLNQLSSGYRNMLALVMDFARRLAQANPQMENPLEAEAVLMIDELDLHLHPTWQQKIIPDLRKVFPNTQIISTTHSPEIVTTVKRHQVKILENYQIKECPTPTRGRSSSDIVLEVLGLKKPRPDTEESRTLTELFDAIDNGNLEGAKQLRDKLQDWEHFDPDLIRADMQIHRLQRKVNA